MIILDIGHTNIKTFDSKSNIITSYPIKDIALFFNYLKSKKDNTFYIGSVNFDVCSKIVKQLKLEKISYFIINHDWFKDKILIDNTINLYEVGLDILSIIYYINDHNYIFLNSGTALVWIKYSDKLDGVMISNNIFYHTEKLLEVTSLKYNYTNSKTFGKNTDDAFSSYLNLFFAIPLNQLILDNNIQKIYCNNVDKKYLKNIKVKNILYTQDATLKGYAKLILKNNI